jgi:hypothetical protein
VFSAERFDKSHSFHLYALSKIIPVLKKALFKAQAIIPEIQPGQHLFKKKNKDVFLALSQKLQANSCRVI